MADLAKYLEDTVGSVKKGVKGFVDTVAGVGGAVNEALGITSPEPSYGKGAPAPREFDIPSGKVTFDKEGKATPVMKVDDSIQKKAF